MPQSHEHIEGCPLCEAVERDDTGSCLVSANIGNDRVVTVRGHRVDLTDEEKAEFRKVLDASWPAIVADFDVPGHWSVKLSAADWTMKGKSEAGTGSRP